MLMGAEGVYLADEGVDGGVEGGTVAGGAGGAAGVRGHGGR